MGDISWLLRQKNDGKCSRPMAVQIVGSANDVTYVRYLTGLKVYMYDSRNIFDSRMNALRAINNGFVPFMVGDGDYPSQENNGGLV
jgi:hypothetical protein